MSDTSKEKKYQFTSNVKLPNMQEILDAASDFTPPTDKKLEVKPEPSKKLDIKELTRQVVPVSAEQAELQKLGDQVADAEAKKKAKELARAEELRRLCKEREEVAKKKADEERRIADEERRKALEAAREKARARRDAENAALAAQERSDMEAEELDRMLEPDMSAPDKMPPIAKGTEEVASSEAAESEAFTAKEPAGEAAQTFDSELAENPFDDKPVTHRPVKEKEEFKETVLEDDYKEEMNLREDSSETVNDDFLDF